MFAFAVASAVISAVVALKEFLRARSLRDELDAYRSRLDPTAQEIVFTTGTGKALGASNNQAQDPGASHRGGQEAARESQARAAA